jgi:glucose/arabinose dehydrogenase
MVAMGSALLMLFANGADVSAAPAIKLTQVYSGFTQPVFMAQPPDGTNRLFVVERAGRIRLIVNGVHQSTPFLDLQSQITSAGEEQGMLGLAFHPNFRANRRFYVYYTDAQGNDTLARYEASTTNPNVASLTTRTILFSFPDRYDNHNGGMLAFGRDGLLYVGIGDEGSSGDPSNNAQNIDSPFGKILRLNGEGLAVPSNPFYSGDPTATRSRVWALGLRNPWRFSFDRANGDMYIGDVGQDSWEEVDRRAYGSGVSPNFQWSCLEGTHPFDTSRTCTRSTQVRPISEYDHSNGSCAITGGYVYRGSRVASLVGEYVYGDYCSGMIWTLTPGTWTRSMSFASGLHIASFAEDQAGNLYVIDITTGRIYRIDDGA